MSIAKQIVVRYRVQGHVRFVVPPELRHPQAAQKLTEGLQQVKGVYRVDWYPRQGKLSIRYFEESINFKSVARALHGIVSGIEMSPSEPDSHEVADGLNERDNRRGLAAAWLKANFRKARETLTGLGAFAPAPKAPWAKPILGADKEQIVVDFCTDLLVLYLIKLHWHMIMGHWIRRPWQFRGEWMATLYLIFLLVRSKKPK